MSFKAPLYELLHTSIRYVDTETLMREATGEELSTTAFVDHLRRQYLA